MRKTQKVNCDPIGGFVNAKKPSDELGTPPFIVNSPCRTGNLPYKPWQQPTRFITRHMHIVNSAVVTLQQGSLIMIMITTELLHMEACPDHMTGQCRSHSGSSWRKAEWMGERGGGLQGGTAACRWPWWSTRTTVRKPLEIQRSHRRLIPSPLWVKCFMVLPNDHWCYI